MTQPPAPTRVNRESRDFKAGLAEGYALALHDLTTRAAQLARDVPQPAATSDLPPGLVVLTCEWCERQSWQPAGSTHRYCPRRDCRKHAARARLEASRAA